MQIAPAGRLGGVPLSIGGGHFPVAEAGGMLSVSLNLLHQLPVHHLWRAKSLVQGADQICEGIRMQPPPLKIPVRSSSEDKACPDCSRGRTMADVMPSIVLECLF